MLTAKYRLRTHQFRPDISMECACNRFQDRAAPCAVFKVRFMLSSVDFMTAPDLRHLNPHSFRSYRPEGFTQKWRWVSNKSIFAKRRP